MSRMFTARGGRARDLAARKRRLGRLVPAVVLSLVALALVPLPGGAAPTRNQAKGSGFDARPLSPSGRVTGAKSVTSSVAKTSPGLLKRTGNRPVPVMIKLDYDSIAAYGGGVRNLSATSPEVTGRELTGTSGAERRYESFIAGKERAFVAELQRRVSGVDIGRRFRVVYGGVAAVVPANRVRDIVKMDGVVAVQLNRMERVLTDSSPGFIGAPTLYPELGGRANAGEGVIYGNLDTGIWPEHPSFEDLGNIDAPPGPARECNYGDNPETPSNDPFSCQNKLIGGAHFTDDYDAQIGDDPFEGTARDNDGHGTHTSSTAAGNLLASAPVLGVERGPIQGIAPGAYVMEYKVCGPQGCFDSDSAAAVQQAILDGVDVINFSISGGTQPFSDPVELAFLDAYAAGVFVSASAGNEGPGASTANHLSPWVATVAASTQTREFATTLTLEADNGDTTTFDGASITNGTGPAPVVLAGETAGYEDPLCGTPAPAGTFDGVIVGCERGVQARVEKGFNVLQGGAVGMVLYNPTLADVETDTHWLPAVHLADGTDFLAFMDAHTGVTGSFPAGEKRQGQGDVMAAFSSRGPAGNFIKPDVTAPGVQILAGDSPMSFAPVSGPPGEFFQAIAGTSMSSPHNAGAAILLRAFNPDWTPGQTKSALMTTATTDVVKEDLTTPADPFDFGAGRIDLTNAGSPGLTFDESTANMAALGNDPVNAVHINIPSVNAPVMPGRVITTRTATNVSGLRQRYSVQTTAPAGSTITARPSSFALDGGESIDLTITIKSTASSDQQFGEIRLDPRRSNYPTLHLPVAFVPQQGSLNLSSSCSPARIPRQGISTCTVTAQNNSFNDTTVDLETRTNRKLSVAGADGAVITGPRSVELQNAELAGAVPGVPSVDPGVGPGGYLPLDAFGIAPIPIGDEEIINFNTDPFVYGGQTYNQVGVDSNGYLIVGGGTVEDNNCCNLPPGPDPARPNNVLAQFWTDLDGTEAEGIFVAVLTDGVNNWIVIESRLNVFGTTSERVFEAWIGIDGTEDISYAYDPANLPADPEGMDFLVGAENQLGAGDMEMVLPTEDLRVTSSDPVPGASATYTVDVRGQRSGTGTVTTEMDSPDSPGTTIVRSLVEVN